MYKRILIPTDGGRKSEKAADHGIELAKALDASIHALYVMDLPGAPRTPYIHGDEEEMKREYRAYGEKVTGAVREKAEAAGVTCDTAIVSGTVHEEIVTYADDKGIDLIVMVAGYRGRFGGLVGSVTEKVVRSSNVPVTALRMGEVRRE
ncbi:universal stress protein [Natronorarus salvus]|uniref:universal stress protein n=1 Tax=Natronorarus salvus TaxID=3117733 RepID=UPI002F26551C